MVRDMVAVLSEDMVAVLSEGMGGQAYHERRDHRAALPPEHRPGALTIALHALVLASCRADALLLGFNALDLG